MMKNMLKRLTALALGLVIALSLAACGGKDEVAGAWAADMGSDGYVTWTFDGKGGCTYDNEVVKQKGTYSINGDQMTVKLELWDDAKTYTFSVGDDGLTMEDNEGMAVSGTFAKQ